ncbi:MAG TPA: adenylate/guanylate cyclase domain-containing protein [Nitrobacter sp.]|nr:adenylate/guanylate cyclase domain-containing protein [Nitrobacter sp.]
MTGLLDAIRKRAPIAPDFRRALDRQVIVTERLRIKALLVTLMILICALTAGYAVVPKALDRLWNGHFHLWQVYTLFLPFAAFELIALAAVTRHLSRDADLPFWRRYGSAFVEASIPSLALMVHINGMDRTAAIGFVAPLAYFIVIILSTLRLDFWLSVFTGCVAAIELFLIVMFYHPSGAVGDLAEDPVYHLMRSFVVLGGGVLAGAVGVLLRRQFEAGIVAATARDRVTNLFGQHVSPQVVERLLREGGGSAGDIRHVAVMFVDFRDFTDAARRRAPHDVVARLDGAFALLVDILDRHSGIVNKFLGDGFLALFGAPIDDPAAAQRAVAAGREMLAAMTVDNDGREWPLRIGIGIHVGAVVAGTVGSPRRKEYTVIGDTVNFAARLEALNKEFGSQFLISSAVRDALGETCRDALPLGDVQVKGYDRPMAVWRLA